MTVYAVQSPLNSHSDIFENNELELIKTPSAKPACVVLYVHFKDSQNRQGRFQDGKYASHKVKEGRFVQRKTNATLHHPPSPLLRT